MIVEGTVRIATNSSIATDSSSFSGCSRCNIITSQYKWHYTAVVTAATATSAVRQGTWQSGSN